MRNEKIKKLVENSYFIDFYCYKEDKWLQYADFNEKFIAVFGSIENAEIEYEKYKKESLIEENYQ